MPPVIDTKHTSIRDSYLFFPAWSQPLWTLLTGKALPLERPFLQIPNALLPALDLGATALGCLINLYLLSAQTSEVRFLGYLLAPLFALHLTGSLRKAQVVYGHHAIHRTLFKNNGSLNSIAARALTILCLSQNEEAYTADHFGHHRRAVFSTLLDADAALLYKLGIQPGKALSDLRIRLLIELLSPAFHFHFLKQRALSNLRRSAVDRWFAIAWAGTLFIWAPLQFGMLPAFLALWLPFTILYQMSALLQFATEHVWLADTSEVTDMGMLAQRCHGRFCGERVPGTEGSRASIRSWLAWLARMLCVHIPVRMAVLVGDLPAHDWHHLAASIGHDPGNWPHAIYERQRAIDEGNAIGMDYRELWGIGDILNHVLQKMSKAPPVSGRNAALQNFNDGPQPSRPE